jgi:tetratricopeptide (TPR) repeat protein
MRHPVRALQAVWRDANSYNHWLYLNRARDLEKKGRYADSQRMVEKALKWDPTGDRAQWLARLIALQPEFNQALALGQEGRLDRERDVLLGLLDRFPREPEVLILLSANAAVRGKDVRALPTLVVWACWQVMIRRRCFAPLGSFGGAMRVRRVSFWSGSKGMIAAMDSPDSFAFHSELAHLEGLLAIDEGHEDASVPFLERAFELEPGDVGIAADLALTYNKRGQVEQALNVLARGLEHRPGDERILKVQALIRSERS